MGEVLALAVAAAVYPQLLAAVVVILTRPRPRRLLGACYLGSLCVSFAAAGALLTAFRADDTVAGTSSTGLGPSAYLVIGVLALAVAAFVVSRRGRELLGRDLPRPSIGTRAADAGSRLLSRIRSWTEHALREGSIGVAVVVGAILGVPGPFDLLAIGHLSRGGFAWAEMIVAIVVFVLIKFVLIELPLAAYLVAPARTATEVKRFAGWMHANKLEVVAGVVGVIGVALIVRGIAGLA